MLGICVVYLTPDQDSETLLKISLRQLSAATTSPHKIYGMALRMDDEQRQRLLTLGVHLPDIPAFESSEYFETSRSQSGEHIHYLDHLVDNAVRDGCTQIAVFDMDSWPITQGWDRHYSRFLSPKTPVVAVVREELEDNFPHPSFTFFNSVFWTSGQSSFGIYQRKRYPALDESSISRPHEPGAGLFAALATSGRQCHALLRNNAWNPHFLMCGIYDSRIFHFGAGSRRPYFAADEVEFSKHRDTVRRTHTLMMNHANRSFFLEMLVRQHGPFIKSLMGIH